VILCFTGTVGRHSRTAIFSRDRRGLPAITPIRKDKCCKSKTISFGIRSKNTRNSTLLPSQVQREFLYSGHRCYKVSVQTEKWTKDVKQICRHSSGGHNGYQVLGDLHGTTSTHSQFFTPKRISNYVDHVVPPYQFRFYASVSQFRWCRLPGRANVNS